MIPSNPINKYVACCICQSKTTRAHRLPALSSNEDKLLRYAKWVNFAAIENVYNKRKYYWICEIHFEDNAFCNHLKLKILRTAVPTLNPPIYEGPSTEDGSPLGPTETKEETLMKIFKEVIDKQYRIEPSGQRGKFSNFISTSSDKIGGFATFFKEKENHLRTEIQDTRVFLKHNSKQASVDTANDNVCLPIIKAVVSSENGSFKTPSKITYNHEKSGYIEKGITTGSIRSSLSQRTRPLILKKSPTSSKTSSITNSNSVDVSDLLKTLSNADSSTGFLSELDVCPTNPESVSNRMTIVKNISAINNEKSGVFSDPPEILNSTKKTVVDNVISTTNDPHFNNNFNHSSVNENIFKITDSLSSVVNLTSNEKDKQCDILSTAINNSDILFSEISCLDEEIVNNKENDNKDHSLKYVKKQPVSKKKYYDPVLINSVLNKMKLKKNGPVCVVTLEKKPDRLFKGFSKSKLVTLYKQQIKKNRKNKKANQGINKNSNDATKKVRKKRRCTCSIHCHRRLNGSKTSSPVININSSAGVKFEGNAVNPNVMNIDPDLADEELFNVENVFNISTILTNVHDRSQIEQLCQMLIESIFRLKSLNIEGTMAKLQVYIAQVSESGVDKPLGDDPASTGETSKSSHNFQMNHDMEYNISNGQEIIISSFQENECNHIAPFISLTNEKDKPLYNDVPITTEVPYRSVNDAINVSNPQQKPKNVKVRLSTFHDHSYVKQESNYIFEKPEYLVKLINIETYRCPRKGAKPPQSGISKKEVERHKKVCLKLNNRIMHLRELIKKKNKNIKSMHRKIKYLGGIVCQEKGIKRIKYPKPQEFVQEKQTDPLKIGSEEQSGVKRRDESKMLIDSNIDNLRIENIVTINAFDSSFFQENTQIKAKNTHGTKTKKNTSVESFDVLYENLIEELCCNEMQY